MAPDERKSRRQAYRAAKIQHIGALKTYNIKMLQFIEDRDLFRIAMEEWEQADEELRTCRINKSPKKLLNFL